MKPHSTAGQPASWSASSAMAQLRDRQPLPPPPDEPEAPPLIPPPILPIGRDWGDMKGRSVRTGAPGLPRRVAPPATEQRGEAASSVATRSPEPAPPVTFADRVRRELAAFVAAAPGRSAEVRSGLAAQFAERIGAAGLVPAGREALAGLLVEACLAGVGPAATEVPVAAATALMRAIERVLPPGAARTAWREALHRAARDEAATGRCGVEPLTRLAHALGDLHGGREMPEGALRGLVAPLVREAQRLPADALLAFAAGLARSLAEPLVTPAALRELLRVPLAMVPLRAPSDMAGVMWLFTRSVGGHWLSPARAEALMAGLLEADDLPPESLGYMAWALARARLGGVEPLSPEAPIHPEDPPAVADQLLAMARPASAAAAGTLMVAVGTALRAEDQMPHWAPLLMPRLVAARADWSPLQVAAATCGLAVGFSDGVPPPPLENALQALLGFARGGPWGAPAGLEPAQRGVALAARPLRALAEPGLSPGDSMALLEAVLSLPRVLDARSVPALFEQVLALDLPAGRKDDVLAMLMRLGSAHVTPEMLARARALRAEPTGSTGDGKRHGTKAVTKDSAPGRPAGAGQPSS